MRSWSGGWRGGLLGRRNFVGGGKERKEEKERKKARTVLLGDDYGMELGVEIVK